MRKLILLVLLASCKPEHRMTYNVEVTYFSGEKDTILVRPWGEDRIWMSDMGCVSGAPDVGVMACGGPDVGVMACGVRTFKVLH